MRPSLYLLPYTHVDRVATILPPLPLGYILDCIHNASFGVALMLIVYYNDEEQGESQGMERALKENGNRADVLKPPDECGRWMFVWALELQSFDAEEEGGEGVGNICIWAFVRSVNERCVETEEMKCKLS